MSWAEDDLTRYQQRQAANPRIQAGLAKTKHPRATQTPAILERTGTASLVQLEIPGEALSQNRIWKPAVFPTAPMEQIKGELARRKTNVLAQLYQVSQEFFRGGIRITKEAQAWKDACASIAGVQGRNLASAKTYKVKLTFYGRFLNLQGEPLKKDVDNMLKLTLDAVADGMGFNDSKFWVISLEKIHDVQNPRTVIDISVLKPLEAGLFEAVQ